MIVSTMLATLATALIEEIQVVMETLPDRLVLLVWIYQEAIVVAHVF
jgi:hypothetical protein